LNLFAILRTVPQHFWRNDEKGYLNLFADRFFCEVVKVETNTFTTLSRTSKYYV
jgi:hypothetical protein